MDPRIVLTERVDGRFTRKSKSANQTAPEIPTVLIATADPDMREAMRDVLRANGVHALWVSGVNEVKRLVARERIAACFCGFWLQDGTYREVIRHLRREAVNIPAIIVAPPACPEEYREYLAAVNLGALDFLCHPYPQSDVARILTAVLGPRMRATALKDVPGTIDYRDRGAA